jgi:hypothetical protein
MRVVFGALAALAAVAAAEVHLATVVPVRDEGSAPAVVLLGAADTATVSADAVSKTVSKADADAKAAAKADADAKAADAAKAAAKAAEAAAAKAKARAAEEASKAKALAAKAAKAAAKEAAASAATDKAAAASDEAEANAGANAGAGVEAESAAATASTTDDVDEADNDVEDEDEMDDADEETDESADAQVALATSDGDAAMATDAAAAEAGAQDGVAAGWRWGARRNRRKRRRSRKRAGRRRNRRRNRRRGGGRRRGLYRWYIRRFKLRCARGGPGAACRTRRRVRFRAYLRARRTASRRTWSAYRRSLHRQCKGPWKSACAASTAGTACRARRRTWRNRCKRRRVRARRSSCRGPWRKRCAVGVKGKACRATRSSWRRSCRARRRADKGRRRMEKRAGRGRVARIKMAMLRSRQQRLVTHRRVTVIPVGGGYLLEYFPATGWFQLYRQDRSSLSGKTATPIWQHSKRLAYGQWTALKGFRLRYVGGGVLFAHNRRTGAYRTFKVNRTLRGNKDILGSALATGTYKFGRNRRIVSLRAGRLLVFGRRGRYRLVQVNGARKGTNVSGVLVTRARGTSWLLARRRAKYAWLGKGVLLQWHGGKFRMLSVRRRARRNRRTNISLLKTLPATQAMGRAWPYRSGAPYSRMVSLGGNLLVFYRTTGSTKKSTAGAALYSLRVTPFKVRTLNNPRFGGRMLVRPGVAANKPWLLGKAWRTGGGKPWRNDPRYCLRYNTFPASGTLAFTQRGKVARLDNAGKAGSTMVRMGSALLDLDKATGSYRVLGFSQRAGMYVQRSFGILPQFKPTWDAVALSPRRLMLYNPTTRQFLLYPVRSGGSSIGKPVASGVLPVPSGWTLIPLGGSMLAWKPSTGQWRVYRTSPLVSGVNATPLSKKFASAGQWCDIKEGKDILALNDRDLLVIDKRSGSYSMYRFNKSARGRRGNVFRQVRARGTWDSPFVSSSTHLIAVGGAQILGFKPTSTGSIYSTWTLGYLAGGTGSLGSLKTELNKFVGTVKQLKRYIKLGGSGSDPALGLLQKPTFAGMPSRDFSRLFKRYLNGVDVKFPWRSTLKYFKTSYAAKLAGKPLRAEGSDGADGIYSFSSNGQPFPDAEQPPLEKDSNSAAITGIADTNSDSGSSSQSDQPHLDANYPVTPSGPQAEVTMDGGATKAWPDGKNMETDDVFDDGTGPAKALQGNDLLYDMFDADTMDPAGESSMYRGELWGLRGG